jgi:hypothetical protein
MHIYSVSVTICASSIIVLQSYLMAWGIERRMVRDISQSSAELFDGWGLLRRAVQEVWESYRIALAGAARELSRELGHSVAGILAGFGVPWRELS